MRASGKGDRDILMLTVPLAILVLYGLVSGGGISHTLRTVELALGTVMDWVRTLLA
jgi:hypothetical protein